MLQSDPALADSALRDLADEAITSVIVPSLCLLAVLLERRLFSKVAPSLQKQLLEVLLQSDNPSLGPPACALSSTDACHAHEVHHAPDAESILIPATVSLLVNQGSYAQAADLCMYHLKMHPVFANVESGLPWLLLYVSRHQEIFESPVWSPQVLRWPLPQTLSRLSAALGAMLADAVKRMQSEKRETELSLL